MLKESRVKAFSSPGGKGMVMRVGIVEAGAPSGGEKAPTGWGGECQRHTRDLGFAEGLSISLYNSS